MFDANISTCSLGLTVDEQTSIKAATTKLPLGWRVLLESADGHNKYARVVPPWNAKKSAFLIDRESHGLVITDNLSQDAHLKIRVVCDISDAIDHIAAVISGPRKVPQLRQHLPKGKTATLAAEQHQLDITSAAFEEAVRMQRPTPRKSQLVNRDVTAVTRHPRIRLEPEFWEALDDVCMREKVDRNELVRRIENATPEAVRSSSVRVFILEYFRDRERQQRTGRSFAASCRSLRTTLSENTR